MSGRRRWWAAIGEWSASLGVTAVALLFAGNCVAAVKEHGPVWLVDAVLLLLAGTAGTLAVLCSLSTRRYGIELREVRQRMRQRDEPQLGECCAWTLAGAFQIGMARPAGSGPLTIHVRQPTGRGDMWRAEFPAGGGLPQLVTPPPREKQP